MPEDMKGSTEGSKWSSLEYYLGDSQGLWKWYHLMDCIHFVYYQGITVNSYVIYMVT